MLASMPRGRCCHRVFAKSSMFFEPERKNSRSLMLVFAFFANAQENKELSKAFLRGFPLDDTAKRRERLNSVLRIVVVPGNVIEIQECEHLVAVLLQALDELSCGFAGSDASGKMLIEPAGLKWTRSAGPLGRLS